MLRATAVVPAGHWTQSPADSVVLDFDERHRRRVAMTGVRGLAFLLDLPQAVMLRGGDALSLDDGRLVEVVAAPEALVEVRAASPADLVRLAWHVGNRHLPAQVTPKAIRLRHDPVIEDMLAGLGAKLVAIEAPFDPEGGAYASAPRDAHDPDHHGHAAHHAHDHAERGHHGHDDHDHHAHGHAGHRHHGHDHADGTVDHDHDQHGHRHG